MTVGREQNSAPGAAPPAVCRHYWVSGRVQGVFFRAATRAEAQRLGITGWVRNLPDGQVEVWACGREVRLAAFETWLHHGPPQAQVTAVRVEPAGATEPSATFAIL